MDFNDIIKEIKDFSNQEYYTKQLFFSNALAGEVGEFCNLIKKYYRDSYYDIKQMKFELADIFIYLVLNARVNSIDLQQAILDKINIVKKRVNK